MDESKERCAHLFGAKVARLLTENDGHFTIRLRRYDAAWMPHPARDLYALTIGGFAVGYGPIGRHSTVAGFAGPVGGYLVAYVVNLVVVMALHAGRARHSQPVKDNDWPG